MRYYGGNTITESAVTDLPKKSKPVPEITGSVTITTPRSGKFTLHRVGSQLPARFHKTYPDNPGLPVLGKANDQYEEPFTVFEFEGDTLTVDSLIWLTTDDGHSEEILIRDFLVLPPGPHPPQWMRSGNRGFNRKPKEPKKPTAHQPHIRHL